MNRRSINSRLYLVAVILFLVVVALVTKLVYIVWFDEDSLNDLPLQVVKNVIIEPERGDIYSSDGKILATSVYSYEVRWDAQSPSNLVYESKKYQLAKKLGKLLSKNSEEVLTNLEKARKQGSRYHLIIKNADKQLVDRIKQLPIFELGEIKGGLILEKSEHRKLPMKQYVARTIGYEKQQPSGAFHRVGIEGGYAQYLRGEPGFRLKIRLAGDVWKPISDKQNRDPIPGASLNTTIDTHIQSVTHQALKNQLEKFEADYGCAVVMKVNTGEVKAIANLTRSVDSTYVERYNYAIGAPYEPGSTFKIFSLMAAMEDQFISEDSTVDIGDGRITFFGRHTIRESSKSNRGLLTVDQVLGKSSNVGVVKIIQDNYSTQPEKFVRRIYDMGLHKPLDLNIPGEGTPYIPHPTERSWSGISMPWMAYGYGLTMTPLQVLTYYNAIANDGEVVKPRFINSIQRTSKSDKIVFEKEVMNSAIASKATVKKIKGMLENVVDKKWGTAHNIKSELIPIAGKTGTSQANYAGANMTYVASFAGYFPSNDPEYSMIVVVHNPNKKKGYYGSIVAAPVVGDVASRIFSAVPDEIILNENNVAQVLLEKSYNKSVDPYININDSRLARTLQTSDYRDVLKAGQVPFKSSKEVVSELSPFFTRITDAMGIEVKVKHRKQQQIVEFQ